MNKPENFNIRDFVEKYSLIYDRLYKKNCSGEDVSHLEEAIDDFEDHKYPTWLLSEFVNYREDLVVSDKEVAAFMFTAKEMGYLR